MNKIPTIIWSWQHPMQYSTTIIIVNRQLLLFVREANIYLNFGILALTFRHSRFGARTKPIFFTQISIVQLHWKSDFCGLTWSLFLWNFNLGFSGEGNFENDGTTRLYPIHNNGCSSIHIFQCRKLRDEIRPGGSFRISNLAKIQVEESGARSWGEFQPCSQAKVKKEERIKIVWLFS